jgi:hypothetical protein
MKKFTACYILVILSTFQVRIFCHVSCLSHWGGGFRLRVFENKLLRKILESERGENYVMRNFVIYALHKILVSDQIIEDEIDRAHSMHGWDLIRKFTWKALRVGTSGRLL